MERAVLQGGRERVPFLQVDVVAERVRVAEGRVLGGELLPQLPRARLGHALELGSPLPGAVVGALGDGAVGDEDVVALPKSDLGAVLQAQARRRLGVGPQIEVDVDDLLSELEVHALVGEVVAHGQGHGIVLVVLGAQHAAEPVQSVHQMDEAPHVASHLGQAAPALEGEHRRPDEPEVGGEEVLVEPVLDALVAQRRFRFDRQLEQRGLLLEIQTIRGDIEPLAAAQEPRLGVRDETAVEIEGLVAHRHRGVVARRDEGQQLPVAGVVQLVHAPASYHEACFGVAGAVEGPAHESVLFEDVDVAAGHARVLDEVDGARQRGDAAANEKGSSGERIRVPGRAHDRSVS